jgi:hypothetical protein
MVGLLEDDQSEGAPNETSRRRYGNRARLTGTEEAPTAHIAQIEE